MKDEEITDPLVILIKMEHENNNLKYSIMKNRKKIQDKIKDMGYKQTKIAEKLGVTTVHLSNYFHNKGNLSIEKEDKLIKMLGL